MTKEKQCEFLIKKLFGDKKTITKKDVEKIMIEQKLDPNKKSVQNKKILESAPYKKDLVFKSTWGSILKAFKNKDEITVDELYKSMIKEL